MMGQDINKFKLHKDFISQSVWVLLDYISVQYLPSVELIL